MNEHVVRNGEFGKSGHRSRLRERLLEAGADGFHDYELVEYLLMLTIPRIDTKPLAKRWSMISVGSARCCRRALTRYAAKA